MCWATRRSFSTRSARHCFTRSSGFRGRHIARPSLPKNLGGGLFQFAKVCRRTYASQVEARKDVVDYLVGFYNGSRLHSAICPPLHSSTTWQHDHLSLCPDLRDRFRLIGLVFCLHSFDRRLPYQKQVPKNTSHHGRWREAFSQGALFKTWTARRPSACVPAKVKHPSIAMSRVECLDSRGF